MAPSLPTQVLLFAVMCGFVHCIFLLVQQRSKIRKLRNQGIPMPKGWNWVTGHLFTLWRYKNKFPGDAFVGTALAELATEFGDTEAFLLDLWPIAPALLIVYSPELCTQITTEFNLPKEDSFAKALEPITGGPSMITLNGEQWKTWRAIFNPGFSAASMQDYVPHLIRSVETFCELLDEQARKGGVFCLGDLTMKLTADVITKLTLNANIDCQRSENFLGDSLQAIIRWQSLWNPLARMNPLGLVIQLYHNWKINKYIVKELENQFMQQKQTTLQANNPEGGSANPSPPIKSIASLVLKSYATNNRTSKSSQGVEQQTALDHHFISFATNQIRLFLFAGSDTTSSSLIYIYHLLSQHPPVLSTLRAEHTAIFGPNPTSASALFHQNPLLLNQCRYTMAVIKETLRLYAPAATLRAGGTGIVLRDPRAGKMYPMDGISTSIIHRAVHLNPRVWPRAHEFLPERWLVGSGHELYPNPAAYRPFEQGPRACIGMNMVYNEMRIVLVLTARRWRVMPAYREREGGWAERIFGSSRGVEEVCGDRAYQTEKAGTHPKDGYPCRVEVVRDD